MRNVGKYTFQKMTDSNAFKFESAVFYNNSFIGSANLMGFSMATPLIRKVKFPKS